MNLLPVDESLLRLGEPLPVALWDARGVLLMPRGSQIADTAQRQRLMARQPQVQAHDHERIRRPWILAMEQALMRNETLGRIADLQPTEVAPPAATAADAARSADDAVHRWSSLRMRLANTLRDPGSREFRARLVRDAHTLCDLLAEDPDAALLVLLHDAARELRDAGVRHSLLVGALAALVAQDHPQAWPAEEVQRLALAGLTMNLSVLALQDRLALQADPLSAAQRQELKDHGPRSAMLLRAAGFVDEGWLLAVAMHHHSHSLPALQSLQAVTPELAIRCRARLIHKADVFAARLSPRRARPGLPATQAARAAFLDESGATDAVGPWLIKSLGLYPPGTLVTLRSGESGIVCRRGVRPSAPWVSVLASASGTPLHEPVVRDTSADAHAVVQAVAPHQLRLRVPLEAVLQGRPTSGTPQSGTLQSGTPQSGAPHASAAQPSGTPLPAVQ